MSNGARVNAKANNGCSSLYTACHQGQANMGTLGYGRQTLACEGMHGTSIRAP